MRLLILAGLPAAALAVGAAWLVAAQAADPPEIAIEAKRFDYTPSHITLKKGVPTVLALTSADRLHGFELPDLHIRADVLPGQTVRVTVTPDKAGTFAFHCDNFCGSGHEDMEGEITVEE